MTFEILAMITIFTLLLLVALGALNAPEDKEIKPSSSTPISKRTYGYYKSDNQLDGDLNDITLGLWKA